MTDSTRAPRRQADASMFQRLLMLQQTTFEALWQVAMTMEPLAAQLAAVPATTAH